ncbi:zinc-dependent metalloprotease [Winogradskyella ouciana]|uniref:T9SS type A sorting domain-containing protein n=1 Tax=Winogradskyella ouciana TaxID=2608631 RepID=A0A7K1GDM2_9FLAO|nr:T9SS type A sorting domain-containing protein [Winogradskyella ouciana]MTE27135.1 T9SS type A sorting domain-containing protein [Winogradskyella ouciana]
MKNFTLCVLLGLLLAAVPYNSHAQDRCGMEEYMEEMMKDPEYARQYEEKQKALKQRLQNYLNNSDLYQRGGTIEIPVAVHFPEASEAERSCLEALAQNQIDILNADYTATNSDISSWNAISSQYPGTSAGVANISFCIATSNHPAGLDPELLEGNPCITIGYNFGGGSNTDGNWSGYLNFVIRNIGALGFSPLFGDISDGDAVTMDNNAFGSGAGCTSVVPGAPYNLGRTTTHELGHFFGLNHTFNADGGGTCGSGGDGIADTPEVANSTYGCPNPPTSVPSCTPGQPALTMNYMDYVNDACMYMFSQDQMTFAEAYISSIQADIKPNVCQPATPGFNLAVTGDDELLTCPTTDNEAVYSFSYTTVMSFSETTTFSASGLPAGATATFSPTSLNSDGAFTLTVGNLMSTAQGTYTITVTGTSSPSSVTESVDVVLNNNCTEIVCNSYSSPQNLNLAIADGSGGTAGTPVLEHIINIPDMATIESMTVNVDVTHTFISDLLVRIVHPDGATFVDVWSGDCGSNDNFDVTFDDSAGALVCASPTVGTFMPNGALSAFNGLEAQGDWTILIGDFFAQDTGNLNDWSIEICAEQALSVSEFDLDDLQVYPNPNNGTFNIGFSPKSGEDITIQVYDIRGRAIFENTFNSVGRFDEVIQLTNAESGVYLLSISDGPQKVTKKIVVD